MKDNNSDTEKKSINQKGEKVAANQENEMLFTIFELDGEDYGVPVDLMVEIVRDVSTFNIPGSPEHVIGATDLRSEVIPIIDLKKTIGISRTKDEVDEVLLVNVGDEKFALTVDRLKDIASTDEDKLIDPSSITNLNEKMLKWIIRLEDGRTVRVLDIEQMMDYKIGNLDLEKRK
ncbi:MAG: chemotaxis protein CheW [Candidatus Thermoplasmatota archaeon]